MRALVVLATLLVACGGTTKPAVGSICDGTTGLACESDEVALDCYDGTVRAVSCVGPAGCTSHGGPIECDVSTAAAGAPCLDFTVGRCTSSTSALLCTSQILVDTSCNVSCTTGTDGSLTCESSS